MGTSPQPAPGTRPDFDQFVEDQTGIEPHPIKPEPVEVVVVEAVRVEEQQPRTISTEQVPIFAANSGAQRIVSALRTRKRITLRPNAANVVIGGEGVTQGTGFLLTSGVPFTLETTDAIYASCPNDAIVYVLSEIREG